MSVLFCDVMTVYNYRRDEETEKETWSRSVVRGVQWRHNRNEISTQGNVQTVNKAESITIDFMRGYGNKPYLPPQEYGRLSEKEAAGSWTLWKGRDILVLGESEMEISGSDDIEALKEAYQYVAVVNSVSDNRGAPRLKSIKVVAK